MFPLYMKFSVVLCHYKVILRKDEKDPVYAGGERRIMLIDRDITFDQL